MILPRGRPEAFRITEGQLIRLVEAVHAYFLSRAKRVGSALGMKKLKVKEQQWNKIIYLRFVQNKRYSEISKLTHIPKSTIQRILARLESPRFRIRKNISHKELITYRLTHSPTETAEAFNLSRQMVNRIVKRYGTPVPYLRRAPRKKVLHTDNAFRVEQ